jgi:pimeloyl-ACP methyl ester carboxylesterase
MMKPPDYNADLRSGRVQISFPGRYDEKSLHRIRRARAKTSIRPKGRDALAFWKEAKVMLLVHGAWHGAWCWTPTIAALNSRGISAVAIDLPGHGSRRHLGPDIGLQDYSSAVVEAATRMSEPPILLGHSMGGMAISAAAEREPGAFRALIYLAGIIPGDGKSLSDLLMERRPMPGRIEDGEIHLERQTARQLFYADCTPVAADWALDQIQPQPLRPVAETMKLTGERFGRLRKDYVICGNDSAIAPSLQREMAQHANCKDIMWIDYGHSPFIAAPDLVAETLRNICLSPSSY